jgi:hypothetical protein
MLKVASSVFRNQWWQQTFVMKWIITINKQHFPQTESGTSRQYYKNVATEGIWLNTTVLEDFVVLVESFSTQK